jgi:nucleotidyltransferase/DNA polymerase involved in DNA repair
VSVGVGRWKIIQLWDVVMAAVEGVQQLRALVVDQVVREFGEATGRWVAGAAWGVDPTVVAAKGPPKVWRVFTARRPPHAQSAYTSSSPLTQSGAERLASLGLICIAEYHRRGQLQGV